MHPTLIYMTAGSRDEALRIGRTLVEERLLACANVFDGVTSVFRWEGEVQHEGEAVLIGKSTEELVEPLTARVRKLHSYDCPCVVAVPIQGGNAAFLEWVSKETEI
ncbi:divalent-cation tolerance protein CutA [Stratiformator vulcanicus]|uniref:Divalent-cation tolerance protein CutA n=1 Tax=Stratiformator vulcanicus TaxID=2527980 RepID=A0A517R1D8_9PLAN|nr:divalent-cation tolerance protein CutA [Stratiformator vulcanicus]QDT37654.1 Divalent-cation tolerance protein CutA [Stratiformator vulcanicus]